MDNEHDDSNCWPCLNWQCHKDKMEVTTHFTGSRDFFCRQRCQCEINAVLGSIIYCQLRAVAAVLPKLLQHTAHWLLTAARSDPRHNLALGKPRAAPGTVRKITNNVATNCFVNIILRSGQPSVIAAHSSSSHHRSLLKTEEESYLALLLLFSFFKSP